MEDALSETQSTAMYKNRSVVIDIENLGQAMDKCSDSPKTTKALPRKGSCRIERRTSEDLDADDTSRKSSVKVVLQLDSPKETTSAANKALMVVTTTANNACLTETINKRSNRFASIHPRKILLFFAMMSSMGTMILIYFTLTINRRTGTQNYDGRN